MRSKVIVAGGGIGGLTAAIALRSAGCEVEVFERADALKPVGAGLHLWTNAMRVLDDLGLAADLEARASVMERAEFRRWRGDLLASWPIAEIGRELGAPSIQVSRADLHAVLLAALPPDAVHLGARITGYEEHPGGVAARLADGTEVHGDVLVGADGIRSAVRSQLLGDGEPREAGYAVWRGILEGAGELVPPGSFCSLWGRGERFVFYDLGADRLYWMSVANGGHAKQPDDVKELLLQRHRGWMEPIEAMIERTPAEAIHGSAIIDRPPVERWGEGRVTLLGDAAHPMTFNIGQGACQAIEDAVVLARELSATADVPAALRAYETARRDRTAKFQTLAWRLGRMGRWESRAACGLRDRLMRVTYNGFALKQHRADMAHAI